MYIVGFIMYMIARKCNDSRQLRDLTRSEKLGKVFSRIIRLP